MDIQQRSGERTAVVTENGDLYTIYEPDGSPAFTMRREQGLTPNGNPIGDAWVIRAAGDGSWIDWSHWRNDLLEKVGVRKTTIGATPPASGKGRDGEGL